MLCTGGHWQTSGLDKYKTGCSNQEALRQQHGTFRQQHGTHWRPALQPGRPGQGQVPAAKPYVEQDCQDKCKGGTCSRATEEMLPAERQDAVGRGGWPQAGWYSTCLGGKETIHQARGFAAEGHLLSTGRMAREHFTVRSSYLRVL